MSLFPMLPAYGDTVTKTASPLRASVGVQNVSVRMHRLVGHWVDCGMVVVVGFLPDGPGAA